MPRRKKLAGLEDYDDAKALREQAGRYLKTIRRRTGLTQSALAEKVRRPGQVPHQQCRTRQVAASES